MINAHNNILQMDTVLETGFVIGAIVVVGGLIVAIFGGSDDKQ